MEWIDRVHCGEAAGDTKELPLGKGKVVLVDADDYEWLKNWQWRCISGYARRVLYDKGGVRYVHMHREIMKCPPDLYVDHINRNPLDNRKCNLRLCTKAQNQQNQRWRATPKRTSRFKGVCWTAHIRRWRASITPSGKQIHLGTFASETEAAKAYNTAALLHFGEFAWLNDISGGNSEEYLSGRRTRPDMLAGPAQAEGEGG